MPRYDLPECRHSKELENLRVTHSYTADPSPPAHESYIVRCRVCQKGRVTEFKNGIKLNNIVDPYDQLGPN